MLYRILAEGDVLVHAAFVVFVVTGGFLAWRWGALVWAHVPAALWGAAIEYGGWICPLTPLENHLRSLAGQAGYSGGFIERYLLAWLYPDGLTRGVQVALGVAVVLVNAAVYARVVRQRWHRRPR